jgi:hypothetical protein
MWVPFVNKSDVGILNQSAKSRRVGIVERWRETRISAPKRLYCREAVLLDKIAAAPVLLRLEDANSVSPREKFARNAA